MTELLGLLPPPSPDHLASTDPSAHKLPSSSAIQAKLVKADLHGCILTGALRSPQNLRTSHDTFHHSQASQEPRPGRPWRPRRTRDREHVQGRHPGQHGQRYVRSPAPASSLNPLLTTIPQSVIPKRNSIFALRIPLYATNVSGLEGGVGADNDDSRPPAATTVDDQGPQLEFEMYGNQLCFRASDRASRKFKFKETIEL